MTIQVFILREQFSVVQAVKALLVYGTLSGGAHLWFIPTILFCYLLTPFFDKVNNLIFEKRSPGKNVIFVFMLICIVIKLFAQYFNPAWIACYYVGHILGKNEIRQRIPSLRVKGSICILAIGLVSIQIVIDYILKLNFDGYIQILYSLMCNYGHTFLGTGIVVLMLDVLRSLSIKKTWKPVAILDFVSYEGYLVHQFYILGPMSLLPIIKPAFLAIVVVFVLTFSLGMIVKLISERLKAIIECWWNKKLLMS